MHFDYWYQGILFIFLFFIIVAFACACVAFIGYEMIDKIGQHPSKTSAIQMSIFLKLAMVEGVSFLLLAFFYKFFSAG